MRFTASTWFHSSSPSSVTGLCTEMPVLATAARRPLPSLSAAATALRTSVSLAASPPMAITLRPGCDSSRSASRQASSSWSRITTCMPASTSAMVIALPMPCAPPVTTAMRRASGFSAAELSLACSSDQYSMSKMSGSGMHW